MKKHIAISLIIFLTLIGCNQKNEVENKAEGSIIEIYLPKERIISNDGSKLISEWNFRDDLKNDSTWIELNKYYNRFAKYDTLSNNIIYAGSFDAKETDLQEKPFIENNEIIGFDFTTSKIKISSSGVEKLWNLQPEINFSRQFILTVDRKPILTGYFFSVFSSSYVKHFYIVYTNGNESIERTGFKDEEFEIHYNSQSEFIWDLDKYDFKNKSDFYNAFKYSGKITE